jgi:histone H4
MAVPSPDAAAAFIRAYRNVHKRNPTFQEFEDAAQKAGLRYPKGALPTQQLDWVVVHGDQLAPHLGMTGTARPSSATFKASAQSHGPSGNGNPKTPLPKGVSSIRIKPSAAAAKKKKPTTETASKLKKKKKNPAPPSTKPTPPSTTSAMKRHPTGSLRKTEHIKGITKSTIRKLARRGGCKRISGLVYEETRGVLRPWLHTLLKDTVAYTEHARRKTVTVMDVVYALKKQGRVLYGFDQ